MLVVTSVKYKESPNVDSNDYYGDKYNASLIKTLNDDLKAQHKARGQVIPTEGVGQTTNEVPQNNKSPLQQAQDPRK